MTLDSLSCSHETKKIKLLLDGGFNDYYELFLCIPCYNSLNVKFVIKKEMIN